MNVEIDDLGDDFEVLDVQARRSVAGLWATGNIAGHEFQALVFPEHAENPEYELGESRISKLWVRRRENRWVVFNWDRGPDVAARDAAAQAIVDFLAGGLADFLFAAGQPTEGQGYAA